MTRDLPHHMVVHTTDLIKKKRRTNKVWWTDGRLNVTQKDSGARRICR